MNFDLSQYETVKERKARFYTDHPDGRIIVELLQGENIECFALFKATVYRTPEDQEKNIPCSTGYAFELRSTEKSVNKYGKEYESVNYSSWTENAEESAVGRALDNMGYSGNKKPSREEMEKAQRMNEVQSARPPAPDLKARCDAHDKDMVWRWSDKKQSWYAYHMVENTFCFGKKGKKLQHGKE